VELKDKVFIVTGASEGLGKEIAKKLVHDSAKVALIARSSEKLSRLDEELGLSASSFSCDVTKKEDVRSTVAEVIKKFGQIDGLINSAGVWQKLNNLEDISMDEVDLVIDTNLKGTIYFSIESLEYLKKSSESVIINISSKSGTRPMDKQTIYCASKFGVKGFTDTLKLELKSTNVKVMGVYPSGMNTKMFEKKGEGLDSKTFMNVEEIADIVVSAIKRPGNISVEEIQIEKY
jgi:NADP-dependent 3-hydroxy acid dehydrogenase YdfG